MPDIWELTPEQAKVLRKELIKRAKVFDKNDFHWHFDRPTARYKSFPGMFKSKPAPNVKALWHYAEINCCRSGPALCLAYLKDGTIKLSRHTKGQCPYAVYFYL